VVVGLVLAAHVTALHVHGEHLAHFLNPIGVVNASNEPGAVEFLVSLRIGENVEDLIDGRVNRSFHGDSVVVAHTSTVPKNAMLLNQDGVRRWPNRPG
jgi:hypothetical protein